MTDYYFDIETLGLEPNHDKIITIQYQALDTLTGTPTSNIMILKEWESSEEDILRRFYNVLNPDYDWDFIPVGFNLRFDFNYLQIRLEKRLKLSIDPYWLYCKLPYVDLKSTFVMMNDGQFKGTSLNWFVQKRSAGGELKDWYRRKDYERIKYYIEDEAKRFLHAYHYMKQRLPEIYKLYNPLP